MKEITQEQAQELRTLLNYVIYQRLPLGDKIIDYLPEHYKQRAFFILEETRSTTT